MSDHKPSVQSQVLGWIASARKAITAGIGIVSGVAAMGVLPQPHATYVATAIAVATAILTYVIPNVEQMVKEFPAHAQVTVDQVVQQASQPAVVAAEVTAEPAPTQDTPESPAGPQTVGMDINELLDALHGEPTGEQPAVTQ